MAAVDLSPSSGTPSGSHRKRRSRFSTVANVADGSPGGEAANGVVDGRDHLGVISQSPSPRVVSSAGLSPRSQPGSVESPVLATGGVNDRGCLDVSSQSRLPAVVSSAGSSPRSQPVSAGGAVLQ